MNSLQQGKAVSAYSVISVSYKNWGKCLTQIMKGVYVLVNICMCVCVCEREKNSALKYKEHVSGEKVATVHVHPHIHSLA